MNIAILVRCHNTTFHFTFGDEHKIIDTSTIQVRQLSTVKTCFKSIFKITKNYIRHKYKLKTGYKIEMSSESE